MGFTTPCLIRKTTPELRVKLESIGYRYISTIDYNPKHILTTGSGTYYLLEEYINSKDYVDCGENEELFIAIAALRDDSDSNQWFTDSFGYWQKCIGSFKFPYHAKLRLHKASVEELIEHFKK